MKFIELPISDDDLLLSDAQLGLLVRQKYAAFQREAEQRKEAGKASARKKMGTPIVIDGVAYDSRAQARKELGMSFYNFQKKYPGKS